MIPTGLNESTPAVLVRFKLSRQNEQNMKTKTLFFSKNEKDKTNIEIEQNLWWNFFCEFFGKPIVFGFFTQSKNTPKLPDQLLTKLHQTGPHMKPNHIYAGNNLQQFARNVFKFSNEKLVLFIAKMTIFDYSTKINFSMQNFAVFTLI